MTKATGRGRGWARKGWSNLAPSTRRRYERTGIDQPRYQAGYQLSWLDSYAKDQERFYGRDADEVKEELADYPRAEVMDAIRDQKDMQALYDAGRSAEAHTIWESRNPNLPEWMNYYHSYFS